MIKNLEVYTSHMHSILQVTLHWTRKTQTIFGANIDETWPSYVKVVGRLQNVKRSAKICVRSKRDLVINNSLLYNAFQLSVVKPKPKQLHRPITTDPDSSVNQSEFEVITCTQRQVRGNACVHPGISFGLLIWSPEWRAFCQPYKNWSKANANYFPHYTLGWKPLCLNSFQLVAVYAVCLLLI